MLLLMSTWLQLNQRLENPVLKVFCRVIFAWESATVQALEKFSDPLHLLTELPMCHPCPFCFAGLAVSVATFWSASVKWDTYFSTRNVFLFKLDDFTELFRSTVQQTAESAQLKDMEPRAGVWELAPRGGEGQYEHLNMSLFQRDS